MPELYQTKQTELKSDTNLGKRSISCELWTDATRWHKLILGLKAGWANNINNQFFLKQVLYSSSLCCAQERVDGNGCSTQYPQESRKDNQSHLGFA